MTALAALWFALSLAAGDDPRTRRARDEVERELSKMVNIPPPRVKVVLEPLDEPNFMLVEVELQLDGKRLSPSLLGATLPKSHTLHEGQLAPGMHTLWVRAVYEDASSVVLSESAGYRFKVPLKVHFEARKGLEVVVRLTPERVPAKDPREQFKLRATEAVEMLAKVDDAMPESLSRPVVAEAPDAGTPEVEGRQASRLTEEEDRPEKERIAEEARSAEEARLEEKQRKAEEAKAARQARLEEKQRKAEEAKAARQARLEEKRRKAEEAKAARQARLEEKRRRAEEAKQAASAASASQVAMAGDVKPASGETGGEVAVASGSVAVDAGVEVAAPEPVAVAEPPDAGVPAEAPPAEGVEGGPTSFGLALGAGGAGVLLLGLVLLIARRRRERHLKKLAGDE